MRHMMIVAAILAVALPAHAGEERIPEPTQRYGVVGVADDDVLNIRAQPDASSEVVGTLTADAQNVVVAGTRVDIGSGLWWQVVAPDASGWVNARYLEPVDEDPDQRETFPLQCVGTEPFWSLAVEEDEAVFETPMEEEQRWQAGPMTYAMGLVGRYAVALEDEGDVGHIAAWQNRHFCSDGMSDIGFPFEAVVIAPDGTVYGGCCRRAGR